MTEAEKEGDLLGHIIRSLRVRRLVRLSLCHPGRQIPVALRGPTPRLSRGAQQIRIHVILFLHIFCKILFFFLIKNCNPE